MAFCCRECNVESDLRDGGKAPLLEQLKTGQDGPDGQCDTTHKGGEIEKVMPKCIGNGVHLLDALHGRMGYIKLAWIDKTEADEASPNKCETQPHNHPKPSQPPRK
jgi:hypothetical protein